MIPGCAGSPPATTGRSVVRARGGGAVPRGRPAASRRAAPSAPASASSHRPARRAMRAADPRPLQRRQLPRRRDLCARARRRRSNRSPLPPRRSQPVVRAWRGAPTARAAARSSTTATTPTRRATRSALESALEIPGERHWAVLGDMLELGPGAPRFHREVGFAAAKLGFDPIVGVGELARHLVDAAQLEGAHGMWFADAAAAAEWAGRRAARAATSCWSRDRAASRSTTVVRGCSRRRAVMLYHLLVPLSQPLGGVQRLPLHHLPHGWRGGDGAAALPGCSGRASSPCCANSVGQNIRDVGPQSHRSRRARRRWAAC